MSQICADGYSGPFCNECAIEYHKSATGDCRPCEGDSLALALVVTMLPIFLIALTGLWFVF